MKRITVFTPTFNRAYLLPRLYESLCCQTSQDFLWLVIDDGSSDGTKQLVQKWQSEGRVEIKYYYKENGGMHTGHNAAYKIIDTELNVCIDSDDYMPDDAVEIILARWSQLINKEELSGIVALDATAEGKVLGTRIPTGIKQGSYIDLYTKYKATGDKKFVLKTADVRKYPCYPEYQNEKLVPLGLLYIMMGEERPFFFLDEVICIVEYQEGGSSATIFKQYKQSPLGFAYGRKVTLKYYKDFRTVAKQYIHLISSALFARDLSIAFKGVNPVLTLLAIPFGVMLHFYIRLKIKN